jgi:hypothetical protein
MVGVGAQFSAKGLAGERPRVDNRCMINTSIDRLMITGLLLAAAALSWCGLHWTQAAWHARQAELVVASWPDGNEELDADEWQRALTHSERAIQLQPGNIDLLLVHTNVLVQASRLPLELPELDFNLDDDADVDAVLADASFQEALEAFSAVFEERQALADRSMELYLAAARARPTWPYVWVDFAAQKARRFSFDEEFAEALRATMEYGGEMNLAQESVTNLMTLYVERFLGDDELRALMQEHLGKQLAPGKLHLQRHLRILQGLGTLALVCPLLDMSALDERAVEACTA